MKIDGEVKSVKRIEVKSKSSVILIHSKTETGLEEEHKCYPDSPNYYHLRSLLSAVIYKPNNFFCRNEVHSNLMTLILLRIDNQLQCIVGLAFTETKKFIVTTQPTNNEQFWHFTCSSGSIHLPSIEAILKNLHQTTVTAVKKKFEWIWLKLPCNVPLTTEKTWELILAANGHQFHYKESF